MVYSKEEFNNKETFINLVKQDFAFLDSPINKIYRKNIINRFDESIKISEDKAFNIDYLNNCRQIAIVDTGGYHYIMVENSLSHSKYTNLHRDLQRVDDKFFAYITANVEGQCDDFINYVATETFLRCIRHYISQHMSISLIKAKVKEMVKNNNFKKILKLKSNSLKGKIVKFLLKIKCYSLFIFLYKIYLKTNHIDTTKI